MKNIRAFSLLELLLVIALLGVLFTFFLNHYQQQTQNTKVAKTALEMQQLLQAAAAYYIDQGQWPQTLDQADFLPYKPFAQAQQLNPWGNAYVGNPTGDNNARFHVDTQTPNNSLATRIAGQLPNTQVNDNTVSSEISIPGAQAQDAGQLHIVKIGLVQNQGDQIQFHCEGGEAPAVILIPQHLFTGKKYSTLDNLCFSTARQADVGKNAVFNFQYRYDMSYYEKFKWNDGQGFVSAMYIAVCAPSGVQVPQDNC